MKKKEMQIFNNEEFGEVRIIGTPDNPLFCLADVCRALELDQSQVARRLDKGVFSKHTLSTNGGNQTFNFINEDGLYDVIFDSRKPEAKKFRKWVTSEVLPSIRRDGVYTTDPTLQQTIDRLKTKELALKESMENIPLYTLDDLRIDIGIRSVEELISILTGLSLMSKENGRWEIIDCYDKYGLATHRTTMIKRRGKDVLKSDILFTDRGRLFVRLVVERIRQLYADLYTIGKNFEMGVFPQISTPLNDRAVEREKTIIINNN